MRHILAALVFLASTSSFAQESTLQSSPMSTPVSKSASSVEQLSPYIDAQSISFSASAFGVSFQKSPVFILSPRVEYFVIDRLAVGAAGEFMSNFGAQHHAAFGPSFTDHLFTLNRFSAYVGAALLFKVIRRDESPRKLQLSVGANYNIRPWFGLGPRISYVIQKTANAVDVDFLNVYFYL